MRMLVKMYPKAAIKLLDKCFVNMFVMGHNLLREDENTEYFGYDFSFLMSDEGIEIIFTSPPISLRICVSVI